MRRAPLLLASAAVLSLLVGCSHGHGHSARFDDPKEWAPRFEDPARDAWQQPDEVIRALALPEEAHVCDIGAATGYFPVRLARALPRGKITGIDVEPAMVDYLARRARDEGLGNLEAVLATPDDPKIVGPVDLVLLVDTFHHLPRRADYFRRLAPLFSPAGRVAIIDFKPESKLGPPDKLAPEAVVEELAQAGYALVQEHRMLPEQYFLVFEPVR